MFSNAGCLNWIVELFVSVSFLVLVLLWVLQLPLTPKQPSFQVPKPDMDSAALGTASERRLLLCGKEEHGQDYCMIVSWL